MAYTLISLVGTGMYKNLKEEKCPNCGIHIRGKNFEGYQKTTYSFDDGGSFQTRLFMQALLECKYRDINQIILLGTDTSSWDCLVDKDEDERDETIGLWSDLFDQCESEERGVTPTGVTRENLDRLEKYLSERFSMEVLIKAHTHLVANDTSKILFDCYSGVTNIVKKDNDILFDITHGFRSMPVLLYQSLQYSLSQQTDKSVEIVYGELDLQNRSKGYARNLSDYWKYSELTNALNVFNEKLDGLKLAEILKTDFPKGSKAMKKFSEVVQTNFSLQIIDVIAQIKNALAAYPPASPEWLSPIRKIFETITQLEDSTVSRTLYNYSKFLNEHKLNVQAVITLQVAVEAAVVEKFGAEENLGDYEWWQSTGKKELNSLKSNKWQEMGNPLTNLEVFRNQIAHGGGKNKNGNFPQAANIPNIYKSGLRGIERLFEELKNL